MQVLPTTALANGTQATTDMLVGVAHTPYGYQTYLQFRNGFFCRYLVANNLRGLTHSMSRLDTNLLKQPYIHTVEDGA
jgi:hypothetical protein